MIGEQVKTSTLNCNTKKTVKVKFRKFFSKSTF